MPLFDLRDQMDHLLKVPARFLQLMVGERRIPGAKGRICLLWLVCRGCGLSAQPRWLPPEACASKRVHEVLSSACRRLLDCWLLISFNRLELWLSIGLDLLGHLEFMRRLAGLSQ